MIVKKKKKKWEIFIFNDIMKTMKLNDKNTHKYYSKEMNSLKILRKRLG